MTPPPSPHWALAYLGLPYEKGSNGPRTFDCWTLFLKVQRERFGRTLEELPSPPTLFATAKALKRWVVRFDWHEVALPRSGDAVYLADLRHPMHVGIFVDDVRGGAVLHTVKGAGSCLPSLGDLRAFGWRITGFYRPAGEA